jgi:hypothetical protein
MVKTSFSVWAQTFQLKSTGPPHSTFTGLLKSPAHLAFRPTLNRSPAPTYPKCHSHLQVDPTGHPTGQPLPCFLFPFLSLPRDGIVGAGRHAAMAAAPLRLHCGMCAACPWARTPRIPAVPLGLQTLAGHL